MDANPLIAYGRCPGDIYDYMINSTCNGVNQVCSKLCKPDDTFCEWGGECHVGNTCQGNY